MLKDKTRMETLRRKWKGQAAWEAVGAQRAAVGGCVYCGSVNVETAEAAREAYHRGHNLDGIGGRVCGGCERKGGAWLKLGVAREEVIRRLRR